MGGGKSDLLFTVHAWVNFPMISWGYCFKYQLYLYSSVCGPGHSFSLQSCVCAHARIVASKLFFPVLMWPMYEANHVHDQTIPALQFSLPQFSHWIKEHP